jgi:hypothetical protein
LESNQVASLYYLLGIINSRLLNWYYQIENYLEIGKPMAEVKGIYLKKLPIAIGTKEQIQYVEEAVASLLDLCQSRYDKKYSFIHYIQKTYEPKKITEKMEDFELLSYKDFVDELKKQKVKLTELQKMELLEIFDDKKETVMKIDLKIKAIQKDLDFMIFDIYKIKEDVIHRIMD